MNNRKLFLILSAIWVSAALVLTAGGILLLRANLIYPDIGTGAGILPITGCRRLDWSAVFLYLYRFAYWFGIVSPLLLIPWYILLWNLGKRVWFYCAIFALPFFSYAAVNIGVQSGFRYRLELRERYGKDTHGYLAVERLMPPEIRQEYGSGYLSTGKTCTVALFLGWLPYPLWNLLWFPGIGGTIYLISHRKKHTPTL